MPGIQLPAMPADPRPTSGTCSWCWSAGQGRRRRCRSSWPSGAIATGVHYPTPVPLQPAYAHLGHKPGDFPVAEDVMRRCLSLPMFAEMTDEQLEYIADATRSAAGSFHGEADPQGAVA